MKRFFDQIRERMPLSWRRKIGPYVAYAVYFYRTRIRGRSWEPFVMSAEETITELEAGHSIIRFGDGEISLMAGSDLGFESYSETLAEDLKRVIKSEHPTLLIGLPGIFGRLEHLTPVGFWFEIHHLFRYAYLWRRLTSPDRRYAESFITRPYLSYKDKSGAALIYARLKGLWAGREVVLIEGEKSRLGVGNDLFDNVRSLKRILGPAEGAYDKVEALAVVAKSQPKETLFLLSLGPAAKVLGYELFRSGYRVLDIGHLDMEYEMFQRGSDRLLPVRYKYFNEIEERDPEDCQDQDYRSSIIACVT
jgi:glycosyltransferase family protein